MRIAIAGAGVAGLSSALFLARSGHDVVVLERDATPLPADPDAAFEWDRRGAPQVRHSHAFLARLRNLLRDELPDVLADLLAAGATEIPWAAMVPPTLEDRSPRPGDEDLVLLACRRTTFEWVLRRAALGTERVDFRDGVAVNGLVADGERVTGLRTSAGAVDADVVLDAGGRRSALPAWLAGIGVDLPVEEHDTGIIYLSRFYRLRPEAELPGQQILNGGDLGYLKYAVFQGDNRTFSVTLAMPPDDRELRRLSDPDRFERALALVPAAQVWVDPAVAEPLTPVHVMAGLINRVHRFVVDERPIALGVHAVGDASVCTNPLYGRGCSLGAVHAKLFSDALAEHGSDLESLALAFDGATTRELVPWYEASVAQDTGGTGEGAAFVRSILTEGLLPLARVDADVNRAWVRAFNLLIEPNALLSDPTLTAKVMESWQARDSRPPEPVLGPTRDEMLAAI